MDFYFGDFETYYDTEYSLSKMDPPSYILDQRFEAICLGVAKNTEPPYIVDGPDIPQFFADMPRDVAFVTHNALFDMCIANWRFGYTPKLIVDTLAMARSLLTRHLKSLSLASVANYLGFPPKGGFLAQARGMTRADLIANGMWGQYTDYNLHDTALCRMIFFHLKDQLPVEEFVVHDMVSRCAVEPCLRLNTFVLAEHLAAVRANKEVMFAHAMLAGLESKDQLMSNDQFADLLKSLGIEPPQKISQTTGRLTWAFAKNDLDFLELQEHEDPRVQALMAARLGFKTTLEETRTERMLNIASLEFPHLGHTSGWMPIPLKIGAAITHRLGGDWRLNAQNWGRNSPIRRAVEAAPGYKIVASDAAQIEARMTAWFCGQWDMVDQFAQGLDVYALFASTIYGYPVNKTDHPVQRFCGKTGVLQLGYQSGWLKYQRTVFILSGKEGEPIVLSDEEALSHVQTYRTTNHRISGKWQELAAMIAWMANATEDQKHEMGPVTFYKNRIEGPNGLCLYYENLHWNAEAHQWFYTYGGRTFQIYGGKLLENIIQFLARIATMQAALRAKARLKGVATKFVHQAHDELVFLARDDQAEHVATVLTEEMSRTPEWAPGLPLKGETRIAMSYGK